MSRRLRHQWVASIGRLRRQSTQRPTASSFPFHRRLRFEALEDRRLLANVTVGNTNDVVNGTTTSIAALIATPGADGISLREAVLAANSEAGADVIGFAPAVTGTIQLTNVSHAGEIAIGDNLTINGPGASLLTIRGFNPSATLGDGARIFNIQFPFFTRTVAINGLTLTGGDVASTYGGGAILNFENLTITGCTISGNRASTTGGGITNRGGSLSVIDSTISGNTSSGHGGGIYNRYGSLTVSQSTISGNVSDHVGGGIFSFVSAVTIDSSTISGNSAAGSGGIQLEGFGVNMTITGSTISGNSARASAGGVFVAGNVNVRHSTITLNRSDSDNNSSGTGGGVLVVDGSQLTMNHTIVAGNLRAASTRDDISGAVVASSAFNLVGVNTGMTGITNGTNGNQIGTGASPINPMLGLLANIGGPTKTHALLAGSPAIDTGDAAFSPPPANDQRGPSFARVFDGDGAVGARIDIGAYEEQPLNLIVDTLADENDGNFSAGDLSLREAIDMTNNASAGADTITFAASLTSGGSATINLTGDLLLTGSVTISGPGASLLTIRAFDFDSSFGSGRQIFRINDGNAGTLKNVSISGLTLTGADPLAEGPANGGAIQSFENLTLARCALTGNAVAISGGDGGAVYQGAGSLSITDCTIAGNSAANGGGVSVKNATATIINTTISGNSANGHGGGVHLSSGSLTVRHSTITLNRADSDNNFSGTGGGLSGSATLDHTIVAGNLRSTSTRDDITGTVTARYSLIGDNTGATITNNGGNQIGTGASPINALLGPLADNAGATFTHGLLTGSPAIDTGDPAAVAGVGTVPLFDQRGGSFARVFGGRIDIGAYERQTIAGLNLVVDTAADENDGNYSAGDLSLREAIGLANGSVGAHTVTFASALAGATIALGTITIGGSELQIAESLTIDARPLAANVTIDSQQRSRIFNITATTGDFTLAGLTLTGGRITTNGSAADGGAIRSLTDGNLTLAESTVSGNSTSDTSGTSHASGGGIWASGDVTLIRSTVSGNSCTYGRFALGGGIYSSGDVNLTESIVSGNETYGDFTSGGGICAHGNVTLTDSTVTRNHTYENYLFSQSRGGGIWAYGAVTLTRSTVSENTVQGQDTRDGGGIFAYDDVTLIESAVSSNSSGKAGGILAFGNVTLIESTVSGNSGSFGGGILAEGDDVTLTQSTVSGNSGIGIWASADVTLTQSTISGNVTQEDAGGGITVFGGLTVTQSTITENISEGLPAFSGGGVFQLYGSSSPLVIIDSIVSNNRVGSSDNDVINDVVKRPQSTLTVNYSLIGTGVTPNAGGNNVVTNDPQLGELTDNGGPTKTHSLLAGSPALDAGDPAFDPDAFDPPLVHDQRGAPFARVFGGRIDIGAYERQAIAGLNLVVDTAADESDGDYSAGNLSLREAIGLANGSPGAHTITFAPPLAGATITLGGSELQIAESLTIDARPLAANVTIDSQQRSRIFNILAITGDGDISLGGLTLIRGTEAGFDFYPFLGFDPGGAILSLTSGNMTLERCNVSGSYSRGQGGGIAAYGNVTLTQCTISGNRSSSLHNAGGGIFAFGDVTLIQSTVSENISNHGNGGGIAANGVTLIQSTVSGNTSGGQIETGNGGGIIAGDVTLIQSNVSGNSAVRSSFANSAPASGGGIFAGDVTFTESTVSGNSAVGAQSRGGGVFAGTQLTINNSTISGNTSNGDGGGIYLYTASLTLLHSTVTGNRADADSNGSGQGGGLYVRQSTVTIDHTIVAGNLRAASTRDDIFGTVAARYSLIGDNTGATITNNGGNLIGTGASPINVLLGPLADNGGPTKTHALLAGSPAIETGDPAAVGGVGTVPMFDQRGDPYRRVFDGNNNGVARIDIGAFEVIPSDAVHALFGDYNRNGTVDAADYIVWRKTLSASVVPPFTGADGDGDGTIDQDDHGVWRSHFGETVPPPGAGSGAGETSSAQTQELSADAPAAHNIAVKYMGKSVVQMPTETTAATAETEATAERTASLALLETRSPGHDSSSRPHRTIHRYQVAESGGNDLPLLLAIDRAGRTTRQDSFANDDNGHGEHRADDDDTESEIDGSLTVASLFS